MSDSGRFQEQHVRRPRRKYYDPMYQQNELHEDAEDLRLRALGIDPEGSLMEISQQIEAKLEAREGENAKKNS